MADVEYDLYDGPRSVPEEGSLAESAQHLVTWFGALLSLALLVGLVAWGYELTQREVGRVPVLRAMEGPMRVVPEDPGGLAAAHQGLSVAAVPAEGSVEPPPAQVILAPEPVRLAEADAPLSAPPARRPANATATPPAAEPLPVAPTPQRSGPAEGGAKWVSAPAAPSAQGASGGIVMPAALRFDGAPEAKPDIAALIASLDEGGDSALSTKGAPGASGVQRSLRPMPRPDRAALVTRAAAGTADVPLVPSDEIDPGAIAEGAGLAQLGTFSAPEAARQGWRQLAATHGALLDGRRYLVQPAESGGRAFFRLRAAGFADMGEARRFCVAMRAVGAECVAAPHK